MGFIRTLPRCMLARDRGSLREHTGRPGASCPYVACPPARREPNRLHPCKGPGQLTLAARPQPIGVGMLHSLRVRDHVPSVLAGMDPLRPDRRLAMASGNVEHVDR